MLVKIFVLGRSGSGKTTAIKQMCWLAKRDGYDALFVKDYPILYKMFQEDRDYRQFVPASHGGFKVVDFDAFDNALIEVEKQVQEYVNSDRYNGIVIIEFARRDYQQVLKKFTSEFLRDSYFFFVESPVEICIERINNRITLPAAADRHYVPEEMMRTYFAKDNLAYMASQFGEEYSISKDVVTCSNTDTLKCFLEHVSAFYDAISRKELKAGSEAILTM